jgi:hypothetical protein
VLSPQEKWTACNTPLTFLAAFPLMLQSPPRHKAQAQQGCKNMFSKRTGILPNLFAMGALAVTAVEAGPIASVPFTLTVDVGNGIGIVPVFNQGLFLEPSPLTLAPLTTQDLTAYTSGIILTDNAADDVFSITTVGDNPFVFTFDFGITGSVIGITSLTTGVPNPTYDAGIWAVVQSEDVHAVYEIDAGTPGSGNTPEPSTFALVFSGAAALEARRRLIGRSAAKAETNAV